LTWTGNVFSNRSSDFFVPEWPKGEFVSIIGLILFGQNHLYVKDAVLQGIPLFRRVSEDFAYKSENLWFPISRSDDRAIPSRRPFVHCSIRPDDLPYRPDNVTFRLDAPLYREASVPACIRPNVSAAHPDAPQ
jgi:hypothetical protein